MLTPGPIELSSDDPLTQCGTQLADLSFKFLNAPRPDRDPPERSLSTILGALGPSDAQAEAYGPGRPPEPRDASRQTTVGKLSEQGFRVVHTPVLPLSPNHVSVYWDNEWDDDVSMMFDGCFDDPKGGRT